MLARVSDVKIREIGPGDVEQTVAVWERSRWDAQAYVEERMGYTHEQNLGFFRDVLMQDEQVWVAERDGAVVGLLSLADGVVSQLFIDPEAQGAGIGSALLDKAKQLSPGRLELFTFQRNTRGRAFYERHGFSVEALGVSGPPESEPDVKYVWRAGKGVKGGP